jgi:chorismate mutase
MRRNVCSSFFLDPSNAALSTKFLFLCLDNQTSIQLKAVFSSNNQPHLMAGPCSAESYEQLDSIAQGISGLGVEIFRAGVWKPRTRPNSFEGKGDDALSWLVEIREKYGYKLAVEVANPNHVESALKAGIDILWLGARTTVNPFYVQEIVTALKGVDIPIIIKNPIHPELGLWRGAIERFLNSGTERISALHRGFYSTESNVYRNPPLWHIPLELKSTFPDLQLLCDVSHICGRRDNLLETAQMALDLQFDGLMVEVHHNPSEALSDKEQQITPEVFRLILENLIVRDSGITNPTSKFTIESLRNRIDSIDKDIISLFAARMRLARDIGFIKKEYNIPIFQPERWKEVMQHVLSVSGDYDMNEDFIKAVYDAVHQESILTQSQVMNIEKSGKLPT